MDGLRVKSLKGRERASCRKIGKSPMRSMNGEEMYRCIVEDGGDVLGDEVLTVGSLGERPSGLPSSSPSSDLRRMRSLRAAARQKDEVRERKPKRPAGRPTGSYGRRRGGYVDTDTGMRLNVVARQPKMAVACRVNDPDGIYWDYNDNRGSKFHGQYRCRCKSVARQSGKSNTNYVPNEYCERLDLPKDPRLSRQIKADLKAQRNAYKARRPK